MTKKISIKILEEKDIKVIVDEFEKAHWIKPESTFKKYLKEQKDKKRIAWVAYLDSNMAGYITLKWKSKYKSFSDKNIPEIKDLNVLPEYRNLGIGLKLLKTAEEKASEKFNVFGIGVGLYKDYGPAQRLYVKQGYIPYGDGITYNHEPVLTGSQVTLDDNLILWLTKKI